MASPAITTKDGPAAAEIVVPPGWSAEISIVSRRPYLQSANIRFGSNAHWMVNSLNILDAKMLDLVTGKDSVAIAPQDNAQNVNITFQYAKAGTGRPNQNLKSSSKVKTLRVPKPPSILLDSVTYDVRVQNLSDQEVEGEAYNDIITTVYLVNTADPPAEVVLEPGPETAVLEEASQAINDFANESGIPEEDLVPGPPYTPPPELASLPVGIIGAGAAGLYTAMILDSLGIKYEILEGSGRHGGRLYTHRFTKVAGPYQYFVSEAESLYPSYTWLQDVGAMRYPDMFSQRRTFDLVRNKLKIGDSLKPVIMSNENCFLHFNGIRSTRKGYEQDRLSGRFDTFRVGKTEANKDGYIPEEFLREGHKALYERAIGPLRQYFVDSLFPDAFRQLMRHDGFSVREYLHQAMQYPHSVIRWIETMEWRTGMFDSSLTETVLASLAFDDPRSRNERKNVDWFCFDGGSQVLSDAMLAKVGTKPRFYQRVTVIAEVKEDDMQSIALTIDSRGNRFISSNPITTRKYSAVHNALRELQYSPSIKFGIQFKSAWWEELGIEGGQSYTDRPCRAVVYPSLGPGLENSSKSNVLIASYNGMQDSQRLGALMRGHDSPEEKVLLGLIMKDLSVIHNKPLRELEEQYIDHHAWDWYANSGTLGKLWNAPPIRCTTSDHGVLGAFAWFGPGNYISLGVDTQILTRNLGQFREVYPHLTMPASSKQRLFFAGDATSACHGWVAGALNSAWRCVRSMLVAHPELNPNPQENIMKKFMDEWGNSEEWDDKKLEKHVYLGRNLFERQTRT
ncbi:hypothetical protein FRC17_001513 [Serendipita sp. 399]|nr:hypothetical protein FRC17_001513 [Serendipita sp. 399]